MKKEYAIQFELKNYDELPENVKKQNDRFHLHKNFKTASVRTFKTKEAAERAANKLRQLDNDAWNITVVEM